MGVAWVLKSTETSKSLELALERAGAVKKGPFKVDCTAYRPTTSVQGQIQNFYILHHSNFPDSSGIFCELNPSGAISPRATSDQGFDLILQKFSSGLASDPALSFELSGFEYALRDFRIRFGTALMGRTTSKFTACCVVTQCLNMLFELVQMFFPDTPKTPPFPLLRQRGHPQGHMENYYSSDTLEQYLRIFQDMRRQA